jgi:hypothetical protein
VPPVYRRAIITHLPSSSSSPAFGADDYGQLGLGGGQSGGGQPSPKLVRALRKKGVVQLVRLFNLIEAPWLANSGHGASITPVQWCRPPASSTRRRSRRTAPSMSGGTVRVVCADVGVRVLCCSDGSV